jgi:endonuclease/exonuclease/phosphatase family metal-dependent hydrolase
MRRLLPCLALLLCFQTAVLAQDDTLRVMVYNILQFPDPVPAGRSDTLRNIIEDIQPQLLMVNELKSVAGSNAILDDALNAGGSSDWRAVPYESNSSSGANLVNMVYYDQTLLNFYSHEVHRTHVRDINEYTFFFRDPFLAGHLDTTWVDVFVAHLKAGENPSDISDRARMADTIVAAIDRNGPNRNIIFGGDLNVYTSTEPGYVTLLDPGPDNALRDPIDEPGPWSGNGSFSDVHTQSTRTSPIFGDGAGGGLDDRFDQLLLSRNIMIGISRLEYVEESYKAWGNPGSCFNGDILNCNSSSVSLSVRRSLFYMSDHLPVVLDLAVTYPIYNTIEEEDFSGVQLQWTANGLLVNLDGLSGGRLDLFSIDGRLLGSQEVPQGAAVQQHQFALNRSMPTAVVLRYSSPAGQVRSWKLLAP